MSGENEEKTHPGTYAKENVIPKDMTVTKAAELLGIGRPALSNFLNGKAALSSEMALRLERVFGADRKHLHNLQAIFTSEISNTHRQTVITGTHAPALFKIRARQIENWANEIQARQELAALLRRLVHSTGQNLTLVDFPAYDNAERPGWDGVVETSTPTPWIPEGKSGWEFGCEQNPKRKAEDDYTKGLRAVPLEQERAERTFVFVTPRNWKGKEAWVKEKAALGHWKDVRAYDASDLEQWLEQSAPTQVWFAERIGLPAEGYRSLEQCWSKWSTVCEPELSPLLFDSVIEHFSKDFKDWLNSPPDRPYIIAADSRDEALAFISCLIKHVETSGGRQDDRSIVIDTPQALQRFDTAGSIPLIAVIHDPAVEKEIGSLYRRCHCIIARPRNDVNTKPDITLELLGDTDFQKALEAMGFPDDKIERLAQESARSPTILRRRLSKVPAIKSPDWAGNEEIARKLLPAVLVGAWHNASQADREIVRLLAKTTENSELEDNVAALLNLEDPPLWSIGEYRGVVSRIDALFGIAGFITKSDLENFFLVAEYVLAEKDPAMDLPENQQWMAPVYGKFRDHSGVLRRGIRETLILLAVYGNSLFLERVGINVEQQVSGLIERLLFPLDNEKILSHHEDLPDYAEAAPEEFLRLLEEDLQSSEPVVRELMRPVEFAFMGGPRRSELLWALEGLAWSSQRFPRVVDILARLCLIGKNEASDNWVNTPENTLQSLFRSWWPQATASVDERIQEFDRLCQHYPVLGWVLCIKLLDWRGDHATQNYRPRWRDVAAKECREVTQAEHFKFDRNVIKLILNWPQHDERTLGDLIQRLEESFSDGEQRKIWDLIDQWAEQTASEDAKAFLRQRIHGCAQVRRLRGDVIAHPKRERESSEKLLPRDLLIRHAWLFTSHWAELPSDEIEDEGLDYEKNDKRLQELRLNALREIWQERSFSGVSALLEKIEAEVNIVGEMMREILVNQVERIGFVKACLHEATGGNGPVYKSCLAGFLWNVDTNFSKALIKEIERSLGYKALLILLLCLPYGSSTWRWLDDKPSNFQEDYWKNVNPRIRKNVHGAEEVNETIDRLTEVNRAPEAFEAICLMLDKVETSRLTQLLNVLPASPLEEIHNHVHGDLSYYISQAFDALDERPGVPAEEKARLEFACLPWLERGEHGIPNLEKLIAESPGLFTQVVACAFKRNDGKEDPPEFRASNPEEQKMLASNANHLLRIVKRIPGSDDQGNIDTTVLKNWLDQVRTLSRQYGRAEISDQKIGEFLARGPLGDDNIWPCRPICEGLESVASKYIGIGFEIGAWDRRGVYTKAPDEGGAQERDLATRYRTWTNKLVNEFPFVSGILENIAKSYEDMGGREDIESNLRRRLPFR